MNIKLFPPTNNLSPKLSVKKMADMRWLETFNNNRGDSFLDISLPERKLLTESDRLRR